MSKSYQIIVFGIFILLVLYFWNLLNVQGLSNCSLDWYFHSPQFFIIWPQLCLHLLSMCPNYMIQDWHLVNEKTFMDLDKIPMWKTGFYLQMRQNTGFGPDSDVIDWFLFHKRVNALHSSFTFTFQIVGLILKNHQDKIWNGEQ